MKYRLPLLQNESLEKWPEFLHFLNLGLVVKGNLIKLSFSNCFLYDHSTGAIGLFHMVHNGLIHKLNLATLSLIWLQLHLPLGLDVQILDEASIFGHNFGFHDTYFILTFDE